MWGGEKSKEGRRATIEVDVVDKEEEVCRILRKGMYTCAHVHVDVEDAVVKVEVWGGEESDLSVSIRVRWGAIVLHGCIASQDF